MKNSECEVTSEIVDEVNKQEYIQSHMWYKKLIKLALKSCQWHDKTSMKCFRNKFCDEVVFDLPAGNLGGLK